MTTAVIANLEKLLGGARDGALLRYALGNEWLKAGDPGQAAVCLRAALAHDAGYTAAWKLLGKALTAHGEIDAALAAYGEGIRVAQTKGDVQAAKEMAVFAKRLQRAVGDESAP